MIMFTTALAANEPAKAVKVPTVTVEKASIAEVIGRVPVSGTLVPRSEVLIYPQVNGYLIEELTVDVGDTVKKGDRLAALSSDTLKVQVAQAQAELTRAQAAIEQAKSAIDTAEAAKIQSDSALARTRQLRSSGTATQANLDQAIAAAQSADAQLASANSGLAVVTAQRLQAQAQLDIAELNLERATITAPIDGIISQRNGQVGAIASASGDPIFKIIENGTIEVEADIIETDLGRLKIADKAEFTIAGIGAVEGNIRLIAPTVDPVTRLGTVKITLNEQAGLRTGLFANGWIITAQRESLTVPSSAVLTDASGTYVLAVKDDVVKKTPVKSGLIWKDRREIISGIDAGTKVVASAGAFFADGDKIKPVLDKNAGSAEKAQ